MSDIADNVPIWQLELPIRAIRALHVEGYETVGDVRRRGIDWRLFERLPNCGDKTITALKAMFAPELLLELVASPRPGKTESGECGDER